MIRFTSFKYSPGDTRTLLRERMRQHLRAQRPFHFSSEENLISDEAMLRLLLNLKIAWDSEEQRARASYEASRPAGEPSFDELLEQGWIQITWGHIWAPRDYMRALRETTDLTALRDLIARRHHETVFFADTFTPDVELSEKIAEITAGALEPRHLNCLTPSWVAARLWEQRGVGDISAQLRDWVDRWSLLAAPDLVIGHTWTAADAEVFRAGALAVLQTDARLLDWDSIQAAAMRRFAVPQGEAAANYATYFGKQPLSLMGRALWLGQSRLEAVFHDLLENGAISLARLLFFEVANQPMGPGPAPRAVVLFDLAIKFPAVLAILSTAIQWNPELLADLALYPPTAALACFWIAKWSPPSGAYDRPLTTVDDTNGKATAFVDAVWFLGEFLKQGRCDPAEAADLLIWFHETAGPGYVGDTTRAETLLASLKDMLAGLPDVIAKAVTDALLANLSDEIVLGGTFVATLDMISLSNLEAVVDPAPLLKAYQAGLATGDYSLNARRMGTVSAAALYRLAQRSGDGKKTFLKPVDVRARLADGQAKKHNPYTLDDEIGRSLRTHIQILSRAIAGLGKDAPADLVDALRVAIRAAAVDHKDKGKVSAFAARFEVGGVRSYGDRPLAADLAMVLRVLKPARRAKILKAILETDEPLVLAQLYNLVTAPDRKMILDRIDAIEPSEAGDTRSLPEVQARINALLAAGASVAAARYIDAEAEVKTFGKVGGRDVQRLRWRLQLLYDEGNWDAILAEPEPKLEAQGDQAAALLTLQFFRGIATLVGPGGNAEAAAEQFRALYRQHRLFAYVSNIFAAEVAAILGDEAFPLLSGEKERRARDAIAELDHRMGEASPPEPSEVESVALNRAILFLALNQAQQAFAVLGTVISEDHQDAIAAFRAVALARMGQIAEAKAGLVSAKSAYGNTPRLQQAEAFLDNRTAEFGSPYIDLGDDHREQIKAAVREFRLMDPLAQAGALLSGTDPLGDFITDTVRAAGASLVGLVPMFPRSSEEMDEDDYSSVLRELLQNRIEMLGWSLRDQSKAGWSRNENPGEPDILVQKGTSTLAAIEAVVSRRPTHTEVERAWLASHFEKVLNYTTANLFFHITYALTDAIDPILTYMESCAPAPPPGFTYQRHDPIIASDSRPRGFVAHYHRDGEDVKVVFLAFNMAQAIQRGAAKAGGERLKSQSTRKRKAAPPERKSAASKRTAGAGKRQPAKRKKAR